MAAIIRLLGPGDLDTFRTIRLESLRAEPDSFASSAEDWESLPEDEWRRRMLDNPVFVALDDEVPVGLMGLLRQRPSKMAHRATLVMVYVRRDLRGSGLASRLLEAATDHAREIGVRQLELAASAENEAAIRFYQRMGFTEIGRIPGGCIRDGREVDDVLMAKRIVN